MSPSILILDTLPELAGLARLTMLAGVTRNHEEEYLMDKVIIAIKHMYMRQNAIAILVNSIHAMPDYKALSRDTIQSIIDEVSFRLMERFSNDGMYEGAVLKYSVSTFLQDGSVVFHRN